MTKTFLKLKKYLDQNRIKYNELHHAAGQSAEDYHTAVGCKWEEQGKCLLVKAKKNREKTFYIYVLPANKKGDLEAVKAVLAASEVKMATREELKTATGCDYGELSPLAGASGLRLIVDKGFLDQEKIYMNAGEATKSFVLAVSDLVRLENPIILDEVATRTDHSVADSPDQVNKLRKGSYNPRQIEPKWAQKWLAEKTYEASIDPTKKKSYLLIEFPYPSGERLHVGHARSYSCLDAVARKRRMQGENVLFPIGWDAFGLPAENYAIKTGVNPMITTQEVIAKTKQQTISWGLSFDWSREIDTTDPKYYKWTQWIFIQLFKKGLAYKANIAVNWCPSCKINLANEEVIDGKCERCGAQTERRMQSQWLIKITRYADRLLSDLKDLDYRSDIKRQQVEWIGRKEGINIKYKIENTDKEIEVFTTRPDTNFGATFIVVAPEHELVSDILSGKITVDPSLLPEIKKYVDQSKVKSELDRVAEGRKKTGVFLGLTAVNNLNQAKLPIWVSDFVLAGFGTGAVIGVPGHDKRDFEFAQEKNLPIVRVVVGQDGDTSPITKASQVQEEEGIMVNSGFLNGLDIHKATEKIMDYLEAKGWGRRVVSYHLRDWIFSRQHYWGEPTPMIFCPKCASEGKSWFTTDEASRSFGTPVKNVFNTNQSDLNGLKKPMAGWYPMNENDLPLELPRIEKYQPTDTGESPLAAVKDWVKVSCPDCGTAARRETDTMPNWAGSNWYFIRYCDPNNDTAIGDPKILKYWLPVDWYNGGMEHTTLHLLYSRFVHKFLYDLGVVPTSEPYAKRTSHGVVLGPDGRRMSKSKGNVINPDDVLLKYGADSFRIYEMFIGPFSEMVAWNDRALAGVYRFLNKVWNLSLGVINAGKNSPSESLEQTPPVFSGKIRGAKGKDPTGGNTSSDVARRQLAKLITKVDSDLESMKFNTAVSAHMEFINFWSAHPTEVGKELLQDYLKCLAPLAPFITEELYQQLQETADNSPCDTRGTPDTHGTSTPRDTRGTCDTLGTRGTFHSIHLSLWPKVDKNLLKEEKVTVVVQINGKTRGIIEMEALKTVGEAGKKEAIDRAKLNSKVSKHLKGKTASKIFYIEGKLLNFVLV